MGIIPKTIYIEIGYHFGLGGTKMKHLLKIISGLMMIMGGLYTYVRWDFFRTQLIIALKLVIGNMGAFIALIGLIIFLIGISERNESIEEEFVQEEEEIEEEPVVEKKPKRKPKAKK